MKKLKIITLFLVILIMMSASALAEAPIKLFMYGQPVATDVDPVVMNGRTLVPIRAVTENMSVGIEWIPEKQEVILEKDGYEVVMTIGSKEVSASFDYGTHIHYENFTLDQAPIVREGRALVPIRFISERLNQSVRWDVKTRSVHIGGGYDQFTDEGYFGFDRDTGTITSYSPNGPKDAKVPDSISGIAVKHIGGRAFQDLGIGTVSLPEGLLTIGENAFSFNDLLYVILPSSLTHIGDSAFYYNEIESLRIPHNVEELGAKAFAHNSMLDAWVPRSMKMQGHPQGSFDPWVKVNFHY